MTCPCHSDQSLYGSLRTCPACKHRSFDACARSCERRKCGYEEQPSLFDAATTTAT